MKSYIYFLMDNFSKMLLNWRVEPAVSGTVRLETIKEAYRMYINDPEDDVMLLVDGGVENNNSYIDSFIGSEDIYLRTLIAQKDITYSNSVIEAQNKLIKYRYLFKQDFTDIHDLRKGLGRIIQDYNYNRPHISLNGLTPFEAMTGKCSPKDKWQEQLFQARKLRIKENSENLCKICN